MLLALGADDSETVINTSTEDTLAEKDPELAVAHKMNRCRLLLSSLAILRSLVEFSSVLPLEFLATVADKSVDIPFALTLLLESAPWLKMDSILGEEYAANMVDSTAKVTRYEAQVWMALYCCLTDPDLRSRYEIDVERRDAIMQVGNWELLRLENFAIRSLICFLASVDEGTSCSCSVEAFAAAPSADCYCRGGIFDGARDGDQGSSEQRSGPGGGF